MQQESTKPFTYKLLQKYASYNIAFIILITALVLSGWHFDLHLLIQPIPEQVAMNPMTALTFILSCLGFMLIQLQQKKGIKIRAYAIIIIALSILIVAILWLLLGLHIYDTGIAQIMYPEKTAKSIVNNNKNIMAPGTAINFLLTGVAIIMLYLNKPKTVQYLSLGIGFISILAIIGYTYEVKSFYGPFSYFAMAFHTAICFLLLSISVLFITSEKGLMVELVNTYGKSKMVFLLFPFMVIIPVLLGKLRLLGEQKGLYNTSSGTALFTLACIIIFTIIIWKFLIQVNRSNAKLEKEIVEKNKVAEAIKKVHRQMQQHLNNMQLLLDTSLDIICVINEEGRFVQINETCEKVWGYKPSELIGKKFIELVHPDDRIISIKAAEEIVRECSITNFENRYYNKNGNIVPLIWTAIWSLEDQMMYCIAKDCTEQKNNDKKIKDYSYRISHIVESINDGFISTDTNWNVTYCNKEAASFFNERKEQIIGNNLLHTYKKESTYTEFSYLYKECKRSIVSNISVNFEFFHKKLNKWFDIRVYPAEDGLSVYFKDISNRKKEEEYLRLLESVVTNATDAIIITEATSLALPGPKIIYVNDAFCKMTGYSKEEILGYSPRLLQGPKTDKNELAILRTALEKKEACEIEVINYRKTGEEYWVSMAIAPIVDKNGTITHFLSIERDITSQKSSLLFIENQNKTLREIAWKQSHLVRAPLARILGLINLMNNHTVGEEEKNILLSHVKTSATELDNTIREIVKKTEILKV